MQCPVRYDKNSYGQVINTPLAIETNNREGGVLTLIIWANKEISRVWIYL